MDYIVIYNLNNNSGCFSTFSKGMFVVNSKNNCDVNGLMKLFESKSVRIIALVDKKNPGSVVTARKNKMLIMGLNSFIYDYTEKFECPILIKEIDVNYLKSVGSTLFLAGSFDTIVYCDGKVNDTLMPFIMAVDMKRMLFKLTVLPDSIKYSVWKLRPSLHNYIINELSNYRTTLLHNYVVKVIDYTMTSKGRIMNVGDSHKISIEGMKKFGLKNKLMYYWLFGDLCKLGRYEKCSYINYNTNIVNFTKNVQPLKFHEIGDKAVFIKLTDPEQLPVYFQYELFFKTTILHKINPLSNLNPEVLFSFSNILNDLNKKVKFKTFQQLSVDINGITYPAIAYLLVRFNSYNKAYWYVNGVLLRVLSYNLIRSGGSKQDNIKIGPGRFVTYKFNDWVIGFSLNKSKNTLEYIGDDISSDL